MITENTLTIIREALNNQEGAGASVDIQGILWLIEKIPSVSTYF
jgi:hypothetical protein